MLNVAQQAACDSSGDLCIVAGAGTGKTTSIISAIVSRARRGVFPSRMFIATFTNRAANDMADRMARIAGADFKPYYLGTFHKNCLKLIRQHNLLGTRSPGFTVIDEKQRLDLVMKSVIPSIMADCESLVGNQQPKSLAHDFVTVVGLLKSMMITPKILARPEAPKAAFNMPALRSFVEQCASDIVPIVCRHYETYEKALVHLNHMDFDDIIMIPALVLSYDAHVRDLVASRFDLVVIDEHQDSNMAQRRLAQIISSKGNLIVVGDDGQSIYGWRGADVSGIRQDAAGMPTVSLTENYRSSKHILAVGNLMLAQDSQSIKKELVASGVNAERENKPELHQLQNSEDEVGFIARRIQKMLEQGVRVSDIAVLSRTNRTAKAVATALTVRGIAAQTGGLSIFEKLEIRFLIAWAHMLYMADDSRQCVTYFSDFACNPVMLFGIGSVAANKFVAEAYEHGLRDGLAVLGDVSSKANKFCDMFFTLYDAAGERSLVDNIKAVAQKTGLMDKITSAAQAGDREAQGRLEDIESLLTICQDKSYADLCDMVLLSDATKDAEESVKCLTVHGAKGMEWDHVFLAGFSQEGMGLHTGSECKGEAWRLAYVATTRARHSMILSFPLFTYNGRQTLPSVVLTNPDLFAMQPATQPDDIRVFSPNRGTTHKEGTGQGQVKMNDAMRQFLSGDISGVSEKRQGDTAMSGMLDL